MAPLLYLTILSNFAFLLIFKVLFPAGSIVLLCQARIKILNLRDKGLYVRHSCKFASGFKYFTVNLNII